MFMLYVIAVLSVGSATGGGWLLLQPVPWR
jgi:hypothetical protein